jgi:hypothetical protein
MVIALLIKSLFFQAKQSTGIAGAQFSKILESKNTKNFQTGTRTG